VGSEGGDAEALIVVILIRRLAEKDLTGYYCSSEVENYSYAHARLAKQLRKGCFEKINTQIDKII